ncbi:MAG: NADH-ubiquinone oxidoreductase-F iron-sulfur binding region domain-containing protein, partial [Desulfobacterales bacterium]
MSNIIDDSNGLCSTMSHQDNNAIKIGRSAAEALSFRLSWNFFKHQSRGKIDERDKKIMQKTKIDDLEKIKQQALSENTLREGDRRVRVTVHMGTCGIACGAKKVLETLINEIKEAGTTDTIITKSGCMGFCAREPLVTVEVLGEEPIVYQDVDENKISQIFKKHILGGKIQSAFALARGREQEIKDRLLKKSPVQKPSVAGKNIISGIEEIPFFVPQDLRVLRNRGLIDPEKLEDYIARDGYAGMAKALSEMTPEDIIKEVMDSGLRGRGGAGFPTGLKWKFAAGSPGDVKYVLCNADEGDPGAYMDRSVLEGDPHVVLEGMVIAGKAIDSHQGYIYCRAEYPLAIKTLKLAIEQARKNGLLGKDILGTGFDFDIRIYQGAGAFVCGEETALMTSIEGKRGIPRPRPPFPAHSGLWQKPSVLNNVETLANIGQIILNGSRWFANVGTEGNKGTKVFALTGDVNNVGLVEVPMGTTLGHIIYNIGGGIPDGKNFKAAQLGGPSGGCIPIQHLNAPVDYETIAKLGAIMGSGGLIIMNEDKCAVDMARFFMEFCQDESCGNCIPCREGTKRMLEILTDICEGRGKEGDIEMLKEVGTIIKDSSLCGLGQTAPNPVLSTIRYFKDEYEAHIRDKRCPAAVCASLFKSPCQHVCPVGMDIPSYIALIRAERFEDAYKILLKTNPFPSVCGRVCDHKCQLKCRRGMLDEALAIKSLKRFITDNAKRPEVRQVPVSRKEKIAIIGAGPAGLTAARDLRLRGYETVVFEELSEPGGMLRWGIPSYRLPRDVLAKEIHDITALGVEIRCNTRVGREFPFERLSEEFDYIFLACGAQASLKLNIEGENLPAVFGGVEFLRDFNTDEAAWMGGTKTLGVSVAVIGGGNSAIDAARCAARLGTEVTILYRRTRKEMPAEEEEIIAAEEEGVKIEYLVAPTRIAGTDGKVTGILCQRMKLSDFDISGRRRPLPIEGSEFTLSVDSVIAAIGQRPDISFVAEDSGIAINRRSCFELAGGSKSQTTNVRFFAGGDAANGPETVIKAIAASHRAADDIDKTIRRINGEPPYEAPEEERIDVPLVIDDETHECP